MQSTKEPNVKKEFQIVSDIAEIQAVSSAVLKCLEHLGLGESDFFDIRLCLEEALVNAIRHGNKSNPELPVRLTLEVEPSEIGIEVQDQGNGFNPNQVEDCTTGDNVFRSKGRGVFLIRNLMDEVQFNEKGNCLRMIKRLKH